MADQPQTYDCKCRKCGAKFISTDLLDFEGDGECASCKVEIKRVAEQVQKAIDARKAMRGPISNSPKIETTPNGVTHINWRQLL